MPSSELSRIRAYINSALAPIVEEPSLRMQIDEKIGIPTIVVRGSATRGTGDALGTMVIPFLTTSLARYWLSGWAKLQQRKRSLVVEQVHLGIWQGDLPDASKTLLLRAEWGPGFEGPHAQPHWHVHWSADVPLPVAEFSPTEAGEPEPFPGPAEEGLKNQTALERVHLAMSARWQLDDGDGHAATCEASQLAPWMGGCVRYIRQELEYIAE